MHGRLLVASFSNLTNFCLYVKIRAGGSQMKKKIGDKKVAPLIVIITEKDGSAKRIGKYYKESNILRAEVQKSANFMPKFNAWGMDTKVIDTMTSYRAMIIIKDTESKWEYKCPAAKIKEFGTVLEQSKCRPQYFLNVKEWTVIRATHKTYIIECLEEDCRHNFSKQCLVGVIKLNREGSCISYEDKY